VKIVSIPSDSIIQKLGFRVGDEISVVNGLDFNDFEGSVGDMYSRGKEWYDQLREETEFQVELEREGVPMVLHYHIPK
jgi:C-terminal processing protease CtpA/Prc